MKDQNIRNFFSREQDVEAIKNKLRKNRFLALVAPPAGGKSTIITKSLIPVLKQEAFQGKAGVKWSIAKVDIRHDPIEELAEALAKPGILQDKKIKPDFEDYLLTQLEDKQLDLVDIYRQHDYIQQFNLLLFIDHFDWILDHLNQRTDYFISLLLDAASNLDTAIYVLVSMNNDSAKRLLKHPSLEVLQRAMERSMYRLHGLSQAQLDEVIQQAAASSGAKLTPDMVTELIDKLYFDDDQLPELRNWVSKIVSGTVKTKTKIEPKSSSSSGRPVLRVKDNSQPEPQPEAEPVVAKSKVTRTAKTAGANKMHKEAEEIFSNLATRYQQDVCSSIFKILGSKDQETQHLIIYPTKINTIAKYMDISPADIIRILELYKTAGILTSRDTPLDPDSLVFGSKGLNLEDWERLHEWIEEETNFAETYNEIVDAAEAYFISGANLPKEWNANKIGRVLAWKEQYEPTEAWLGRYNDKYDLAMQFLDDCEQLYEDMAPEPEPEPLPEPEPEVATPEPEPEPEPTPDPEPEYQRPVEREEQQYEEQRYREPDPVPPPPPPPPVYEQPARQEPPPPPPPPREEPKPARKKITIKKRK